MGERTENDKRVSKDAAHAHIKGDKSVMALYHKVYLIYVEETPSMGTHSYTAQSRMKWQSDSFVWLPMPFEMPSCCMVRILKRVKLNKRTNLPTIWNGPYGYHHTIRFAHEWCLQSHKYTEKSNGHRHTIEESIVFFSSHVIYFKMYVQLSP